MGWCKLNLHMTKWYRLFRSLQSWMWNEVLKSSANTYIKIILARVALGFLIFRFKHGTHLYYVMCYKNKKRSSKQLSSHLIFFIPFDYCIFIGSNWLWRWKKSIWKFAIFFSHIYIHVHVYVYICLNRDLSFEIIMRPNRISHSVFWIVI